MKSGLFRKMIYFLLITLLAHQALTAPANPCPGCWGEFVECLTNVISEMVEKKICQKQCEPVGSIQPDTTSCEPQDAGPSVEQPAEEPATSVDRPDEVPPATLDRPAEDVSTSETATEEQVTEVVPEEPSSICEEPSASTEVPGATLPNIETNDDNILSDGPAKTDEQKVNRTKEEAHSSPCLTCHSSNPLKAICVYCNDGSNCFYHCVPCPTTQCVQLPDTD